MKKVALYVRVSTKEQKVNGISVDSQIDSLNEWADQEGYEVAGIYNDAGFSASKSYKTRPALLQMIADCQAGKVDLVAFTKLDRFFRNVPDYYACVEQMASVPWIAIWEDYETVTSSGKFKVNIMLSVAQAESDRTSERIKAVKEYQRSLGRYVGGSAPFGYKVVKSDLIIDEDKREITRAIFDTYLMTRSVNDVLEMLRARGCKRSRVGIYNMLQNPTYYGDANGYQCEPYITEAEFLEIKKQIGANSYGRRENTDYVYLFNGVARCGCCGKPMAGTFNKQQKKCGERVYKYYRCTGWINRTCTNKKNITERKIEKYLLENLDKALSTYKVSAEAVPKETVSNEKQIKALEQKLKRIGDRYEDGDISRDEYREKRDAIKNEILSLKSESIPLIKDIPEGWKEAYLLLDEKHRKQWIISSIDSINVYPDHMEIVL